METVTPTPNTLVANKVLVQALRQYLLDTKYATYARLLSIYPVEFDGDPEIAPAYTDGTAIHIAPGMNLSEQSLAVRHELLHILLMHKEETTWRKGQNDHTIRNISGDAELSNYYDDEDNELFNYGGPLSKGINVHVNSHKWHGKLAPDIYKELASDAKKSVQVQEAISNFNADNPFGDCVPKGIPKPMQPKNGKGTHEPVQAEQLSKEQAESMLDEILEQTTERSEQAFDGPEYGGTVSREEVEATTKLHVSLTRYFNHDLSLQPRRTYSSPHKQSTPTLMRRGRRRRYVEDKTLVIYIDRSGSMTNEKTGKADRIVENTTKRLRDVKIIKKYFASAVGEGESASLGRGLGGGTNYGAVAKDITKNGYKTVAIITDDDMNNIYSGDEPKVDMAWICAVQCKATRISNKILSTKTVLEVAL